jgi:exodeoxyribonuclease-3
MQETKLADEQVPQLPFQLAGYEVAHHGEGRWNGVAIASRVGVSDVVTNFGDGPVRDSRLRSGDTESEDDFNPFDEARMITAVCGGIRFVSLYAPNGRVVGSPFYEGKLLWFERLHRWLTETRSPDEPLVVGGDLNATPADEDVGTPPPHMAALMYRSRSGPPWPGCESGVSRTPSVATKAVAADSRGGTIERGCFKRTWA